MTEKNFNREEFTHGIIVNDNLENVFQFIGTANGICKWFIGDAFYKDNKGNVREENELCRTNDEYVWKWFHKDLEVIGKILESSPPHSFRFSFGPTYIVTISASPLNKQTKVTLNQKYSEGADRNEFNFFNCCTCWVFFLTNLKSVAENSIDLREKEYDDEMLVNR